jgi:hypothetical protein
VRFVVGLFLVAHGLVHLLYVAHRPPDDPRYPFVPETAWIARALGLSTDAAKAIAGVVAVTVAIVLGIAGIDLIVGVSLWAALAVVGAAISLILMVAFYHRWLTIGIAIDLAIIGLVWTQVPASLFD